MRTIRRTFSGLTLTELIVAIAALSLILGTFAFAEEIFKPGITATGKVGTEDYPWGQLNAKQVQIVDNYTDLVGDVGYVILQSSSQVSSSGTAGADTEDMATLTVPDAWFTTGKTLKFTAAGTLAGGNTAPKAWLYVDDGAQASITFPAATVGDWICQWTMYATGAATQDILAECHTAAGAGGKVDYDTDTTNFSDGGTTTVKVQIDAQHASDTMTGEYARVEAWELTSD